MIHLRVETTVETRQEAKRLRHFKKRNDLLVAKKTTLGNILLLLIR